MPNTKPIGRATAITSALGHRITVITVSFNGTDPYSYALEDYQLHKALTNDISRNNWGRVGASLKHANRSFTKEKHSDAVNRIRKSLSF